MSAHLTDAALNADLRRHDREIDAADRAEEAFVDWRDNLTPAEEVEYMRAWMDRYGYGDDYDDFLRVKWDALPRETGPDYFGDYE